MIKTEPFDAARYLKSPESRAELLNDALASGDAGYVAHARKVIVRARAMTPIGSAKASPTNPTSRDLP
jgi:DNA-binding phage protein